MDENIPAISPQPQSVTPAPVVTPQPTVSPPAVSPQTPMQEQPITPQISKPKNKFLFIMLIILGLVALGFVGIFVYGKFVSRPSIPLISPEPTAQVETPTPDPTVNWKTYINQQLSFSFKYPGTWTEGIPAPEDTNAIVTITADEKIGDGVEPVVYYVRVSNSDKPSVQKYTDLQEVKELSNGFTVYKTTQELSRSGVLTYLFTKDETSFIKLSLDPFTSEVSVTSPKFPKQDIYLSTFNQILSTFRFTQ